MIPKYVMCYWSTSKPFLSCNIYYAIKYALFIFLFSLYLSRIYVKRIYPGKKIVLPKTKIYPALIRSSCSEFLKTIAAINRKRSLVTFPQA